MISEAFLKSLLDDIPSPFSENGEGLLKSKTIESLTVEECRIICVVSAAFSKNEETQAILEKLLKKVEDFLRKSAPTHQVLVVSTQSMRPSECLKRPWGVQNVQYVIAVASGKGGVGKSTISLNLARGFKSLGLRVGILDADIYGPSLAKLLDVCDKPTMIFEKKFAPVQKEGLSLMSMAFLMDVEDPLIWRGPMIQNVIRQFLEDVVWGNLDVLVVDLPPGTGDAHLSLVQKVSLSGAVIVSTPQDLSLIDARKAIGMFEKLQVPILGIVENMSMFICPNCRHESAIFSKGGAQKEAAEKNIPFLGEIPLDPLIRIASDAGEPLCLKTEVGAHFLNIAKKVYDQLIQGVSKKA